MKLPPVLTQSVLITGCSTGIGASAARVLRDRGWTVIPTARKEADLEQLRADGFTPVPLDIADPDSVIAAVEQTLKLTGGSLGALINNAGFSQSGAVEDLNRSHFRHQFEVNVFGLQDLTNRLIPLFRKQGYGRIINISSVGGRISLPLLGCYSASKFALEALSDALRVELTGSGVGVILMEPGAIITAFRKNAALRARETLDLDHTRNAEFYAKEIERRIRQEKKPDLFTKGPEVVSARIVHALESTNPKRRYRITIPAHLAEFFRRFAPAALIDWVFYRRLPSSSG